MSDSVATSFLGRTLRRRSFLRVAGATAASSALVLAGCGKDTRSDPGTSDTATLSFKKRRYGLLNFAYLLEQIEAAFYQKVVNAFPPISLPPTRLLSLICATTKSFTASSSSRCWLPTPTTRR